MMTVSLQGENLSKQLDCSLYITLHTLEVVELLLKYKHTYIYWECNLCVTCS